MPQRRAFRTGRQVAGLTFTRLAKAHGHDGDAAIVVKRLAANSQPLPQPVTGRMSNQPSRGEDIRGVRISLLVRELKSDREYTNDTVYSMGNRTYGPFRDSVRRVLVSQLVEVKNHGLQ